MSLFVPMLLVPAAAAGAVPGAGNPYLAQAKVFYQGLEFEKCVQRLVRAATWKSSPQEQAEIELYNGLCLYNLGRKDEVKNHFRDALKLDPHVDLPVLTSPKLVSIFDEVAEELAPQREAAASAAPAPGAAPAPNVRPLDRDYSVEAPRALQPSVSRSVSPPSTASHSRWPLVSMGVGGAGLVAGGVLGVLASRDAAAERQENSDFNKKGNLRTQAYGLGQAADYCYIVGGTLAAAGLVLQFTLKDAPVQVAVGPQGAGVAGAFW